MALVLVSGINALWQARINKQSLDSQHKLAVQGRVAGVYEDMLEMVGWQMEVVNATKPIIGELEPPAKPEDERIRRVQARIGVHGSREVKDILERWARRRNEFFNDAWELDRLQKHEHAGRDVGTSMTGLWKKVVEGRTELHAMVRELEDAVSAEMRA